MSRELPIALVVDDSATCRAISAALLESFGFCVATAGNGREAVDATSDALFDLILMDCEMPVMNGLQATFAIRQARPEFHSLIVGVTSKENRDECLAVGMDDHFEKPLTLALLICALQRWGWKDVQSKPELHQVQVSLHRLRDEILALGKALSEQYLRLEREKVLSDLANAEQQQQLKIREDALKERRWTLERRERFFNRREQACAEIDEYNLCD